MSGPETKQGHPLAVLVDLDGTLVDVASIRHLVAGARRDFDAFHRASIDCPPKAETLLLIDSYKRNGTKIIVVSSRSNAYLPLTNMWLALNAIEVDEIYMRDSKDSRPDVQVKTEMLETIRKKYIVEAAIDDREDLLENWANHGVPTLHQIK